VQRSGIAGALIRRWYLFVPGLLLTAALCAAAAVVVPPTYSAKGYIVLLPPQSATQVDGGNPYLALGGLDSAVSILSLDMNDSNTSTSLLKGGASGTYLVAPDLATAGPVLIITANNSTAVGALQTLDVVMKQLPKTLSALQSSIGAQRSAFITSSVIAQDHEAAKVLKSLVRALLVAAVGGLAATIVGIAVIDSLIARRRGSRKRRAESASGRGESVAGGVEAVSVAERLAGIGSDEHVGWAGRAGDVPPAGQSTAAGPVVPGGTGDPAEDRGSTELHSTGDAGRQHWSDGEQDSLQAGDSPLAGWSRR
jgi:hypothetical protein